MLTLEPHFCLICDRPCLQQDLCKKCAHQLPWVTHLPPLKSIYMTEIQSIFSHEKPITHWIHQFKYRNQLQLTTLFTQLMIEHLHLSTNIEQITAIPLHHTRLKERGYNQAELLAKSIAKQTQIDYQGELIIRKKKTQSQVGLKQQQRQKNINNSFKTHPNANITTNQLLIIDDVYTTGATLNEVAKTIKKTSPNTEIIAWTIARAM